MLWCGTIWILYCFILSFHSNNINNSHSTVWLIRKHTHTTQITLCFEIITNFRWLFTKRKPFFILFISALRRYFIIVESQCFYIHLIFKYSFFTIHINSKNKYNKYNFSVFLMCHSDYAFSIVSTQYCLIKTKKQKKIP